MSFPQTCRSSIFDIHPTQQFVISGSNGGAVHRRDCIPVPSENLIRANVRQAVSRTPGRKRRPPQPSERWNHSRFGSAYFWHTTGFVGGGTVVGLSEIREKVRVHLGGAEHRRLLMLGVYPLRVVKSRPSSHTRSRHPTAGGTGRASRGISKGPPDRFPSAAF